MQLQEIMQRQVKTVASKNYSLRNDVPVQDRAKLFQNNIPTAYRNMLNVTHKTLRKGVNLVQS